LTYQPANVRFSPAQNTNTERISGALQLEHR
jgi:hypothetical protein